MLGKKIFLQFISEISLGGLGFLCTLLISRFLGAETIGIIGYMMGLFGLLSSFSDLGFAQTHLTKVSQGKNLARYNGTYLILRSITAVFFLASAVIYFLFFKNQDISSLIFFIFLFYFLFNLFSRIPSATFEAKKQTLSLNFPQIFARLFRLIATFAIIIFSLKTIAVSLSYLLEAAVAFLIFLFLFKKYPLNLPRKQELKDYFQYALPLMALSILAYILGSLDKVIIKNFWNYSEVGFFFAVSSLSAFPNAVSNSAMTLYFPQISQLTAEKNFSAVKNYCFDALKFLAFILVPLTVFFIFFNKEIVTLFFGREFIPATAILSILVINTFFLAMIRPYYSILLVIEKHHWIPLISFLSIIILIIADLILIPKEFLGFKMLGLGAVGAALGNLLICIISGTLQIYLSYRYKKIGFNFQVFYFIFAGLLMFVITKFLNTFSAGLPGMVFSFTAGFFIYLAFLFFLKQIKKKDLIYLWQGFKLWKK